MENQAGSPARAVKSHKRIEIGAEEFNPFAPEFVREPHAVWARLVNEFPIAWHRDLKLWVISSHALCAELLKSRSFTPNYRVWENAPPLKSDAEKSDFDRMTDHSLFMADQKTHLRLRKLTMPAFSKPVMAAIDERIHDLITGRFDEIGRPSEFDVFRELAQSLPARSIARMIGVPVNQEQMFHEFSNCIVLASRINLPPAEREAAMLQAQTGIDWFKAEISARRAANSPGVDFLGQLISAEEDDETLSDWDILALISALLTAGSDTTTDLYTYLVRGLLDNPQQFQMLKDDPGLIDNAVVELMRHGSMGKFPFFRFAVADSEFAGQTISAGQAVLVNLSAAWHDPAKWAEPGKLDFQRNMEGNLVFGAGPHFCIGTYLVRVQARILLQEMIQRFPNATLADGDGRLDYDYSHHNARRISRLIVRTGA